MLYFEELDKGLPQEGSEVEKCFRGFISEVGRLKMQVAPFEQLIIASGPAVAAALDFNMQNIYCKI